MAAKPIEMIHDPRNNLWYEGMQEHGNPISVVASIPDKYHEKAKKMIIQLGDKLKINENGKVVYSNNKLSDSYFRDLLLYYLDNKNYPKPYDMNDFVQLISNYSNNSVHKWKTLY